jgi:predicted translin family RNA/ssDNA-binding protein
MDDVYFLIPGLRRKCDIARRIIEATRGDVTLDSRRSSLENAIERLAKALETKDE